MSYFLQLDHVGWNEVVLLNNAAEYREVLPYDRINIIHIEGWNSFIL